MPVFMKERDYIIALHQARTIAGLRKVTDQHVLRQSKSLLAGSQVECGVMLVLVLAREHIEINPAKQLAAIEHVVNGHVRMPCLRGSYTFVGDAVHVAGEIKNALQNARVFEIRSNGLRVVS